MASLRHHTRYSFLASLLLLEFVVITISMLSDRDFLKPVSAQESPVCDSGLYLLLTTGQIERVGNPPIINGGFLFDGDLARDMERAVSNSGAEEKPDLVVLDGSGVTHFVENAGDDIPQDFLFPPTAEFPNGRAVDLVLSRSSEGLWVLTDYGGIYRAGDTRDSSENALVSGTSQMGFLGYDIPIGPFRDPRMANPGGASIHAVALVVIDINEPYNRADGYIVIDSMGAHYCFNPDGTRVLPGSAANVQENDPARLLDPDPNRGGYLWPFFPGLDIARDAELYPETQEGIVVFDGWGGIHPVPVDDRSNAIFYTRNEDPDAATGTLITTVGMPYLVMGFDDPETSEDEGNASTWGADAYSIFQDFEFSAGCPQGAFYTLDKFGGVYVFGSARTNPELIFTAWRMPYIASQNAQDMEVFAAYEGGPTPTPSLTPSSHPTPLPTSTATLTPTLPPTVTETPTDTTTETPTETLSVATYTFTMTGTPVETPTPTMTPTMTSTGEPTGTETTTETSTDTPTEPLYTPTDTDTETAIATFTVTMTMTETRVEETPTFTATVTDTWETGYPTATFSFTPTLQGTDTATPTEAFVCRQAVNINLFCAGETSPNAAPFQIRLVPKIDTNSCEPVTCPDAPLAVVEIDPASVADENPMDETPFSCDEALAFLVGTVVSQLNTQGFVAQPGPQVGVVYVQGNTAFSCCLCTDEAGLPCDGQNAWPLDVCGLGNLGDGINGNEASFTETDSSGLTSGLGAICLPEACEGTMPSHTQTPSGTATATSMMTPTVTSTQETTFTPTCSVTGTSTETPFSCTCTPTITEYLFTPTCSVTGTSTDSPTNTPTPTYCVQAARIQLYCASETAQDAVPFQIIVLPRLDVSACEPITYMGQPIAVVEVDPSLVAVGGRNGETPFSCDLALDILTESIIAQFNSQGFPTDTDQLGSIYVETFEPVSFRLCTSEAGLPCSGTTGWPIDVCGLGNLGDGVNGNESSFSEADSSGLTSGLGIICGQDVCRTPTPTFTSTITSTPTITDTRTFTFTRTITKTPTITYTRTSTGTPTNSRTWTLTRTPTPLPPTQTPTVTLTPTLVCVHAVNIQLVCAGATSPNAPPFYIKLVPGLSISGCGPLLSTETPFGTVEVEPASVAIDLPDGTEYPCQYALNYLAESISAQLNSKGFRSTTEGQPVGSAYVHYDVPFSCCLCTDEAGLSCGSPNAWPLDVCGLGNLGDGISGNETSFTDVNDSGMASGLGVICLPMDCRIFPTATPTITPSPTITSTPTFGLPILPNKGPQNLDVPINQYDQIRYVSASIGADEPQNGSRDHPWASLIYALSQINDACVEYRYCVLVSAGRYGGGTVTMRKWVDLYGGFNPTDWNRDIFINPAILDGEQKRHVVRGCDYARIDGFVIENGKTGTGTENGGPGIHCWPGSPLITNNEIRNNYTEGDGGGGVFCIDSSPTIQNNLIHDNYAGWGGGGIAVYGPYSAIISDNIITNNKAKSWSGGGISCDYLSYPVITRNIIINNQHDSFGGGISCLVDSHPTITNNIIAYNHSTTAGGIGIIGKGVKIYNNTIYNNSSDSVGAGIYSDSNGTVIRNCIIWGNSLQTSGQHVISNCDIEGGWPEGTDIHNFDPQFMSLSPLDLHLSWDSPCRDLGIGPYHDEKVPVIDVDGDLRQGDVCDLGADEISGTPTPTYDPSQPTWTPTNTKTPTPTKTPTATSTDTQTPTVTFTQRPTWTPDPNREVITIDIPGMPEDAYPMRLLYIPGGTFMMGNTGTEREGSNCNWCSNCACEKPQHEVIINYDYYLGETEVTQAQWQAIMGDNPAQNYGTGNDYPIYYVSWNEVAGPDGFIDRLNSVGQGLFRLPSEAEWEYACRGPEYNPHRYDAFSFGDDLSVAMTQACQFSSLFDQYMWWCPNSGAHNHPVAEKLPNDFGLYDMHGNVNEMVQDNWHDSYDGAPTDGSAWETTGAPFRVIRSGNWHNGPVESRSAFRHGDDPAGKYHEFRGFRLAQGISGTPTPTYDPSQPTWTPTNTKTATLTKTPTATSTETSTPTATMTPDPDFPLGQDVSGLWDFESGNLSATIGNDLAYRGNAGTTTQFGTTTSFGIPDINGIPANIMRFAPYPPADGIQMFPGIEPNGGGARVNQYSLIVDILYPASSGGFRSIFQTDENNANDGDFFIRDDGGIGISVDYDGNLTRDVWHRLAITFELTNNRLMKYVDGALADLQYLSSGVDGRWSLNPAASTLPTLLFSDNDNEVGVGYVNSITILRRVLTPEEILLLGGPSADGIFPVLH